MDMGLKIAMAAMMVFFIWRLWPATKHALENDEKGTSNDWMTVALLLGGVVLFVIVLMKLV